ncbi:MAG: ribbon-helix-helix protein, CopG family, partial [Myxococcota bacterium]
GKDLDHRSDIFSLAVVLYECITGLKLFSGDNDLAIMNNIIEGKIYPPSYFRDDVPQEVEAILMKGLEKDRKRRYQSAFDMQFDIDQFLAGHEFSPSNVHLSNFMKQLFKEDIEKEQERRARHETPAQSKSGPPPPPRPTAEGEQLYELSGSAIVFDDERSGLSVALPKNEVAILERMAQKAGKSKAEIVREIVSHYLKYQL